MTQPDGSNISRHDKLPSSSLWPLLFISDGKTHSQTSPHYLTPVGMTHGCEVWTPIVPSRNQSSGSQVHKYTIGLKSVHPANHVDHVIRTSFDNWLSFRNFSRTFRRTIWRKWNTCCSRWLDIEWRCFLAETLSPVVSWWVGISHYGIDSCRCMMGRDFSLWLREENDVIMIFQESHVSFA